jgi:transcriptional regulator with XRE-family HTH domain
MTMGEVVTLASRLKEKRRQRGISQAQAARELEVARTAYRLWELEAARPAPDRWRLVARWLGVTMTTLLLSEGLISGDEAEDSDAAAVRYQSEMGETSDIASERQEGDFFRQGRTILTQAMERGVFTAEEGERFAAMLDRIEQHAI